MNNFYAMEVILKERHADLLREAEQARLLKSGREAGHARSQRESIISRLGWLVAGRLGRNVHTQVSQPCS